MLSISNQPYLLWLILTYISHCCVAEQYGTCDQTFHIFKNTRATSDSERDCTNAYKIFPYIEDEGANKFHDGECAYQCKLQLHDTCFAVHAPQTMQHNEGLVSVHTFERKMTEKWKYVLDNSGDNANPQTYDSFLDFNMGFYVSSLDEYITLWSAYSDDSVDLKQLEYIGIEWHIDTFKFYSLLIHSPYSAINYEFMSQKRPKLYTNVHWIESDIQRCTFKAMNNPYPWDREDSAVIVPVRLSQAVTDIGSIYNFYVSVMGANLLYDSYQIKTDIDSQTAETLSVALLGAQIELQFIKRPNEYTYGDFNLELFQSLLMETHASIITSPYCGIDRWFDNHIGYNTYQMNGYMDQMIANLNKHNMIYRVYKLSYEHSSVLMKTQLDTYGFDTQYGAIVIDPTGMVIEVNGYISDAQIQRFAPVANPQWCQSECTGNMEQGSVDPSHVYIDIGSDIHFGGEDITDIVKGEHSKKRLSVLFMVIIISAVVFVASCVGCVVWYCCCRSVRMRYNMNNTISYKRNEHTPLMTDIAAGIY